ncbi:TolC family protein [Pseudomonas muyukensis]|uniref:TolC family protein n=1 Tax=Pseudomonas muyukensis TaxID=2842357 RepID=A0ABX8MCD7_9PSED|nr:TolC family protein [Pseudomonas muyukensis]QXH35710.1 TolC family protein [Pseudomonas muyukensis]
MTERLVLALLLSLLGLGAQAQPPLAPAQASRAGAPSPALGGLSLKARQIDLSLSDAIYLGLRDNRAIRSAYLERIAQKFDLRVAEDRFTPKLVVRGNALSNHNQADRYRQGDIAPSTTLLTPYGTRVSLGWAYRHTDADLAGLTRNDGANLTLIQPLLRGAGRDVATAPVQLARLGEQVNRLALKDTVAQSITRIITAYRALLQSQEQLQIAGDALARARQLLEVNQAMIGAGRMAAFEIVQTEAEVATQELGHEEARNQLDAARLALLQLLALDLDTPLVASDAVQADALEVDAAQAMAQAETMQPNYLIQLIGNQQAAINLTVARNERLWDVSLVGGGGQVRDRNSHNGSSRSWENYVGVQVEIPIGDLSTRQAEVQARVGVENQQVRVQEARQQLQRDVTNAVRDIAVRWRQYQIALRAQTLSQRKLQIEREKLTVGRSSNFQVLSFENDLRSAQNARLNALISYLNAQAELDQTLGTTLQSWDIALND